MNNLPVEVLHLIFLQLVTRDKLECMTVCRQWKQVIKHILFRVVYIQSLYQLNKLIRRIKKDPTLGAKVERLILKLESVKDFDETILIDIPNVREFTLHTLDYYKPVTRAYKVYRSHPWRDRIERIAEDAPIVFTKTLLHSGSCKNLTRLSLGGIRTLSVSGVIASLDNTPALKVLELWEYEISLQDLELLHYLVPALTSITMRYCSMNCIAFPSNIDPATSVRIFQSVKCNSSYIGDFPYIRYIMKKYTNLEEMGFSNYVLALGTMDAEAEVVAEIRTMMASYFKKLGLGLKTLSLDVYDDEVLTRFDFDVLDKSGCQIEKLTLDFIRRVSLFEKLANTTQVNYIQSLTVDRFLCSANNHNGSILLKWLSRFTALKELSLSFHSNDNQSKSKKLQLNLADLLDTLAEAQVEALRLAYVELSFNTSGATRTYPLIKALSLDSVDLKYNADVAISRSLIYLRRLTLANCVNDTRPLMFPMTHLSYLEVSERYSYEPLQVLIMTIDNNQQRLYTLKVSGNFYQPEWDKLKPDPLSLPSISSQPYNGSIDKPTRSIVCKSVSHCFMINIRV